MYNEENCRSSGRSLWRCESVKAPKGKHTTAVTRCTMFKADVQFAVFQSQLHLLTADWSCVCSSMAEDTFPWQLDSWLQLYQASSFHFSHGLRTHMQTHMGRRLHATPSPLAHMWCVSRDFLHVFSHIVTKLFVCTFCSFMEKCLAEPQLHVTQRYLNSHKIFLPHNYMFFLNLNFDRLRPSFSSTAATSLTRIWDGNLPFSPLYIPHPWAWPWG